MSLVWVATDARVVRAMPTDAAPTRGGRASDAQVTPPAHRRLLTAFTRPRGGRYATAARPVVVVVVLAFAVAAAWPVARDGWTQSSHYALVRALASGRAEIDADLATTGDVSYWHGHYYSTKAPGLAVASLPLYVPLERAGLWPHDRRAQLWLLTLWTAVTSAVLLILLVRRVADRLEPGSGLFAALGLAVASMVLPFSTLLFSHITGALLVFAAFALLLRNRDSERRAAMGLAAGALAGAAVLVEYQTALAGVILVAYAAATAARRLRGAALYAVGFAAGIAPLAAYNWWAFGSPTHMSVVNAVSERGASGHDEIGAHAAGLLGITQPSLAVLEDLLLEDRGLLLTTPIVAAAFAGVVLLWFRGRRAEAGTIAAVVVAYFVYNAGVTTPFGGPFGGESPGPRYLITTLPFLFAPLGLAYRRAPGVVLALAGISVASMAAATATRPTIEGHELWQWWTRIRDGHFTDTLPSLLGVSRPTGWASILPFALALAVVVTLLVKEATRLRRPVGRDAVAAAVALCAWYLIIRVSRKLDVLDPRLAPVLTFATLIGTVALVATITGAVSRRHGGTIAPVAVRVNRRGR